MACKEDLYKVGDRAYLIRQMPPRLALQVEVYLAKTVGQPLLKAFTAGELTGEKALTVAIGLFAEKLDVDEMLKTMHNVFRFVGIQDVCIRILEENDRACQGLDVHFAGRNRELLQVFAQALKVNFADFFAGLPFLSNLAAKAKGLASSASQISTPISSDPSSQTQSSATTSAP